MMRSRVTDLAALNMNGLCLLAVYNDAFACDGFGCIKYEWFVSVDWRPVQ